MSLNMFFKLRTCFLKTSWRSYKYYYKFITIVLLLVGLITLINVLIDVIEAIIIAEIIKRKRRREKESVTCVIKKDIVWWNTCLRNKKK